MSKFEMLHSRAVDAATRFKSVEAELISILEEIDRHEIYMKKGHSSLFKYVVSELRLSESVAYNLIAVSRKSREVPALKVELENGAITLSNARKIVPVLNVQNQSLWLEKARTLSQRQLEKEIVRVRPEAATPEKARYVSSNRVRLEIGLTERGMLRLRRAQDLLSQSKRRAVLLEEAICTMTDEYLKRHDPIERAKRQNVRKGLCTDDYKKRNSDSKTESTPAAEPVSLPEPVSGTKRVPIPAALLHSVNLRDQRRCTYQPPHGKRCNQSRWIEIHHIKPVSLGGKNTVENLTTLCSSHHKWIHMNSRDHE